MFIPLARPDIQDCDIERVTEVLRSSQAWDGAGLRSGRLSQGPAVEEFEQKFAEKVDHNFGIAVNSGTSGLFLSLLALGIGSGDEVITTPFTFISTVTSIIMTGATPVFVDIDFQTFNIDPEKIEAAITDKTRAVLPVDVFGKTDGMGRICAIAHKHGLPVIEDACEALGSSYAGIYGDLSVFGFYPNKQITTGEGGMIVVDCPELVEECRRLRSHGGGVELGYNFRMSDINAALGVSQLDRLDEICAKRQQIFRWYQNRLAGDTRIGLPVGRSDTCWFAYVIRTRNRDAVAEELQKEGIETRVYFPAVHKIPWIEKRLGSFRLPKAEYASNATLALPFHATMTEDEVDYVCTKLGDALP